MTNPGWQSLLSEAITADGRILATLQDAREFILDQPVDILKQSEWSLAADLLMRAANFREPEVIVALTDQIKKALAAEPLHQLR